MLAGESSSSRAHAQIQKCVDEIDGTVKSDRSVVVFQYFGLNPTIGFQADVSDASGGKHPESSHQLIAVALLRGGAIGRCPPFLGFQF